MGSWLCQPTVEQAEIDTAGAPTNSLGATILKFESDKPDSHGRASAADAVRTGGVTSGGLEEEPPPEEEIIAKEGQTQKQHEQDSSLDYEPNLFEQGEKETSNLFSLTSGSQKRQKGFITNYLTSLSTEQIIRNTLTGFLFELIRKRGNLMQFESIVAYTQARFDTLRKPNGKPYNS
eukprot:CAMPEP_0170452236 /NCGR_PEP_ID=MMETSP0123-20130129/1202_1 /TAXON_ID=182087 /ORGANISM="Favella ehrenbergii, Strain Fehren 1" /LENGTH=176 /DNA_ID=CAMNT_0010714175 /DNA_START=1000 /DNA_END=1532 /DNA_ORIENTATION=+